MAEVKPFGTVYYLADPRRPFVPRYVGKTVKTLTLRLAQHVNAARRGRQVHSAAWIRWLAAEGRSPVIRLLGVAWTEQHLNALERSWIASARMAGIGLCNLTEGGEGTLGWRMSEATRAKQKAAYARPDVKVRMRAAAKLRMSDPAFVARLIAKGRETKARPEVRARLSAANKAAWIRPERREKACASHAARWARPGAREAQGLATRTLLARPDVKARQSAGIRAAWAKPEVKEKIRAALRAAWVRRRARQRVVANG